MGIFAKRDGFIRSLSASGSGRVLSKDMVKLCRGLAPALLMFTACFCMASKAFAASSPSPDQKTVSIIMPAVLDTGLDSKKRSAGDQVEAKTAAQIELPDGTVIPREAKIVGRVTESKARSKGDSESSMTIVFEKAMLPQGKVLEIKGSLQAVAPNPNPEESGGGVDYGSSMNRSLQHAGPGQTTTTTVPILNAQSVGAQGMKDLALTSEGVLTSTGKQVKLDHGVQLLLKIQIVSH
jgi:hypothetical protein